MDNKYPRKKLKKADTRVIKNIVEFKPANEKEEDISVPEIEQTKSKLKDLIELGDCLSTSEIIENISKAMTGHGDMEKLRRMLNLVFEVVDWPEDPRHGEFFNNVFAQRLWSSLNMLQKRWLIKNDLIDKDAISVLRE